MQDIDTERAAAESATVREIIEQAAALLAKLPGTTYASISLHVTDDALPLYDDGTGTPRSNGERSWFEILRHIGPVEAHVTGLWREIAVHAPSTLVPLVPHDECTPTATRGLGAEGDAFFAPEELQPSGAGA